MVTEKCTITKNKVTMITDQNVKNRSLFCWANCLGGGSEFVFIYTSKTFLHPVPSAALKQGRLSNY